eukprot:1296893-Pleurochrysis_carterae.AAC.1
MSTGDTSRQHQGRTYRGTRDTCNSPCVAAGDGRAAPATPQRLHRRLSRDEAEQRKGSGARQQRDTATGHRGRDDARDSRIKDLMLLKCRLPDVLHAFLKSHARKILLIVLYMVLTD